MEHIKKGLNEFLEALAEKVVKNRNIYLEDGVSKKEYLDKKTKECQTQKKAG